MNDWTTKVRSKAPPAPQKTWLSLNRSERFIFARDRVAFMRGEMSVRMRVQDGQYVTLETGDLHKIDPEASIIRVGGEEMVHLIED